MKVLCLGLGSIGQRHIRNLKALRECDVYWLPSGTQPTENEFVKRFDIKVCASFDEAVDRKPDFALVSNPTSRHIPPALDLAKANIPFLLEKPVSHSAEGLDELQHIVDRNNLKVLVTYNFRYHPGFKKMCQWINEGRIGTLLSLRAELGQWLPDWHPGRDYRKDYSAIKELGGGVILDLSHEIDLAYKLFGGVTKVSAIYDHFSSLEIETEDIVEMSLLHNEKRISHVHLDYCQRVYSKWLTVVGEEGTISWNYMANQVELMRPDQNDEVYTIAKDFERDDMYKQQLLHWFDVLEKDAEPEVSLKDGIYVTRLVLAAKQSSEEERHIYI